MTRLPRFLRWVRRWFLRPEHRLGGTGHTNWNEPLLTRLLHRAILIPMT